MSLERFCFFFSSWDDSVHNNFSLIKYCNLIHRKSKVAFYTSWTVARQAPLSMGFSRQEYWSGWPFPSSGDLPNPGIEPASLRFLGRRVFSLAPPYLLQPHPTASSDEGPGLKCVGSSVQVNNRVQEQSAWFAQGFSVQHDTNTTVGRGCLGTHMSVELQPSH